MAVGHGVEDPFEADEEFAQEMATFGLTSFDDIDVCMESPYAAAFNALSDARLMLGDLTTDNTFLTSWFERDRAHIAIYGKINGSEDVSDEHAIVEFWDDAVLEALEDGSIKSDNYHESLVVYAKARGIKPGDNVSVRSTKEEETEDSDE